MPVVREVITRYTSMLCTISWKNVTQISLSSPDHKWMKERPYASTEPGKENKGTGTAKVAPVKAATVSDEAQTPETVSTTEGISDESTEVAEKSQNEETLPETGDKKAEAAGVLGALAATMGITGLDASRRRKASAKVNRKDKKNGK